MAVRHRERHRTDRIGWLRAAVLGANDGIVSTASLVLGVAAAHATHSNVMVAGIAGLVAGAMSMAAGECVSVRSQADSEEAALALERSELAADEQGEARELKAIYVGGGLEPALAQRVAEQLMAHDALGAHARDELGISEAFSARPIQAAFTSAASFAVGGSDRIRRAADRHRLGQFPSVSRRAGQLGSPRRRRTRVRRCGARNVLGCARDGVDGRGRRVVRYRRLMRWI